MFALSYAHNDLLNRIVKHSNQTKPMNMKTSGSLFLPFPARRWLGTLTLLALMNCVLYAQINPADPSLRIWLKADTLAGSDVPVWTDSSTHGTKLSVPPLPNADPFNDLTNHTPQLIVVSNNNLTFNAVQFREAFDPVAGDPTHGHLADRLWQTNNLDANDPTLIDPTNDITLIVVLRNDFPLGLGGYPCIIAKRGSAACPYEFGENAAGVNYDFITYAGSVVYAVGDPFPLQPEWSIIEMNVTAGGTLTFRQYFRSAGGWANYSMTGVARGGFAVGEPFTISCHTQAATADNVMGNGAYERFAGAIAETALFSRTLASNELASVENYLLTKYFLQPGPPVITEQPQSQEVAVFSPVTFNVLADGTPPFTYQWLKGGAPITNAPNSPTYTIPSVKVSDAGTYSVKVSNNVGFTNSHDAILTVISPTNKPTVVSALLDYTNNTLVTLTYSELVNVATATNHLNYALNHGGTVSSVDAGTNTDSTTTVVLTTSPITIAPTTLTINSVQDRFGNVIATNSQVSIPIPGNPGTPPTANRLLWLAADTGLLADAIGVYEWDDQSGAANNHMASPGFGNAQPGQVAFPNGMHPVVTFDGTAGLTVASTADFNLQVLTAYVVGDVDNTKASRDFLGNWEGWTLGLSDGQVGVLKWVTHTTVGDFSLEPAAGHLGNRVPAFIAGTFANPGDKALWLNGTQIGVQSNTSPIVYTTARGLTIGSLFPTPTQTLIGDVAEVLIYGDVSPTQDAAVQNYIVSKYFSPSTSLPTLASATSSSSQNTNVTVVFSGPVTAATASQLSNYGINHGINISAVTVVNSTTVKLTTAPLISGPSYTLTVSGVADWTGNTIATNSPIAISGIPVLISLQKTSGGLSLSWDAPTWKLQSADSLTGPWSTLNGAASPFPVTPTGDHKFYRLIP